MRSVLSQSSRMDFYPRPPRGGRRHALGDNLAGDKISIHALREEGDALEVAKAAETTGFLSTPSARRATKASAMQMGLGKFLSTPSARRATTSLAVDTSKYKISIHALREEGDATLPSGPVLVQRFLSTPSARRATFYTERPAISCCDFYPRPPRGGRH